MPVDPGSGLKAIPLSGFAADSPPAVCTCGQFLS